MWRVLSQKNKQRKVLRFLFPQTVSQKAVTRAQGAVSIKGTKYIKNE